MRRVWVRVLMGATALAAVAASPAAAQTKPPAAQTPPAQAQAGSVTGTVADKDGKGITGATVRVRNTATGVTNRAFTNTQGVFTVGALPPGQYVVTVELLGYAPSTADVTVTAGQAASTKIVLESKPLPAPDMGVPAVIEMDDVNRLPMRLRDSMQAASFLPGVNTFTVNRNSTINGLPGAFLSVTFDGIDNTDNYDKSTGGLFAPTTARFDAAASLSATLTTPPADVPGAALIGLWTRSGAERWAGSAYESYRPSALRANDWFSKNAGQDAADNGLHQYGIREGGSFKVGGDKRAFFFVNYEELRRSGTVSRTRTVLNQSTQNGIFRYLVSSGGTVQVREVNLFTIAAGFAPSQDPTVLRVLTDIRGATALTQMNGRDTNGRLFQTADPNLLRYDWQSPVDDVERQPVARFDMQVTSKHRVGVSFALESISRDSDVLSGTDLQFPGFANSSNYKSQRPLFGVSVTSTITDTITNEFTGGYRWGTTEFGSAETNGAASFASSGGYALALGLGLSDAYGSNGISTRTADTWSFKDTVRWQRGRHGFAFGGLVHLGSATLTEQQVAPGITFGVDPQDPALGLFTSTALPGASPEQRAAAASLFALLTGRVNGINRYATLNNSNGYDLLGNRTLSGKQNEFTFFAQDTFKVSSKVTLTAGAKWVIQSPLTSNSQNMGFASYADACGLSGLNSDGGCRFYQVGSTFGSVPSFDRFGPGTQAWNIDWNNVGASASLAWRPSVEDGLLRNVFGDPESAMFRLAYADVFGREGMGLYLSQIGVNPGSQLNVSRSAAYGNLIPAGESYPIFLSQTSRLGPATYPSTAAFPMDARAGRLDSLGGFVPDISVPRARTLSAGFTRAIDKNTTAEFRWIATRADILTGAENYNEIDIFQNGFLTEFRLAMVNLEKNVAAGRGATFAYFGPGTGTSPLPTFLAYLNGQPLANAGDPARYTGSEWSNITLVSRMSLYNADPYGAAGALDGDGTRRANALAAGIAANYFVMNPDVSSASMLDSKGSGRHDALQLEIRRRMSSGLQVAGSYQYAWALQSRFVSQRFGYLKDPAPIVRHTIKAQGVWSAPGGINVAGVAHLQAATIDFGNVRLVGMTPPQFVKEYKYRIMDDPLNPGHQIVTMLPADIILNTQRAFATDPTSPTGYSALGVPEGRYIAPANSDTCIQIQPGDCARRTNFVQAPWTSRIDLSIGKAFQATSRLNFEVRLDVFNVLNSVNYVPVANPSSSPMAFQVTQSYFDLNTYDPGSRMAQIVLRVKW